jgi:hypothetical protein
MTINKRLHQLTVVGTFTPVNAVKATKSLTISGVVVDGETVTFDNPARGNTDVYEFMADTAQTKTTPTNIGVDITTNAVKASNTLTLPTEPTATDTMTIGGKVYTFVAHGAATVDGNVDVGTDLASAKLAIVAAINGTDGHNTPNPKVTASAFAMNVCTLTALVGGVAGNAVATVETFTAVGNIFSAGVLSSGADCSAVNAVTALVAAITAHDTQGVGAVDATGGVITLTADIAGVVSNAITLAKTMAHGAFAGAATTLSGGIDGTVGTEHEMAIDDTYLYLCLANNTIASSNWRRVAHGTVY